MYRFTIPGRLAGCNEYIEACRRNRYVGAKMKKDMQDIIKPCISYQGTILNAYIIFRWYEPNRKRDVDNIAFGHKWIFDTLVEKKILPDDSQKYVRGFTDHFYVDKKNPRIEVTILECGVEYDKQ